MLLFNFSIHLFSSYSVIISQKKEEYPGLKTGATFKYAMLGHQEKGLVFKGLLSLIARIIAE